MYAEAFGINGAAPEVEEAAKWVQWAQAGILAGATANDGAIRYNLGQFWQVKSNIYQTADAVGKTQLDRLDTFAHGFWQALETGKMYSATPSYWDFWKKWWIGGTPDRPESIQAATAAAAAAAGQEAAAQRTGGNFGAGMTQYAQNAAAAIPAQARSAAGLWEQTGVSPLGIPLWGWLAGAGILAVLILTDRK